MSGAHTGTGGSAWEPLEKAAGVLCCFMNGHAADCSQTGVLVFLYLQVCKCDVRMLRQSSTDVKKHAKEIMRCSERKQH